ILDLHRIIAGNMVPRFIEQNILDPLYLIFRTRYRERGFSFDEKLWPHVCTVDPSCPHTSRHTSDSNRLFFSFDEHMALPVVVGALTFYPSILREKKDKALSYEGCDIWWTLGGGPCENSGRSWMRQRIVIDASFLS
ncbi:uncharacterized protein LACBIDRAFT_336238, partial [Laccaria bicolor S238N-H82]